MLDGTPIEPADVNADMQPLLLVIIDTEEEFDWAQPLSRASVGVDAIGDVGLVHDVFDKYDIVPTYVIDYPVASTPAAVAGLRALAEAGRCVIGTHLHPWVNPPHDEAVTPLNSYAGNLPAALERTKLEHLTRTIEASFGRRPTVYKAGRYGLGPNTATILQALGYQVDCSVVPYTSFGADGGPDFRRFGFQPSWFGRTGDLLELPLSVGFSGRLAGVGPWLFPVAASPAAMAARAPGVLARLGLLERIRLTPEGADLAAHQRLTRSLLNQGCRIFSYTYHSPSLRPGCTPYVRDQRDLARFLEAMDRYFDYFIGVLGGRPATPMDVHRLLQGRRATAATAAPIGRPAVA